MLKVPFTTPKVVHIIDSLRPGGAERVLIELVNGLHKKHFDVEVCVTRNGTDLVSNLQSDIKVIVLDRLRTWDLKALKRFAKYCREHEVRILHAHGRSSTLFAALIKILLGNKVCLIFHDHNGMVQTDRYAPPLLKLVAKLLVDHYIGVAPFLQFWAISRLGLHPNKTVVLENAIDLEAYRVAQNCPKLHFAHIKQPLIAVMVANIHPPKDHAVLIEAMAQTRWARTKLHILFVGAYKNDDYFNHCQHLITQYHLESNFTFLGSRLDVPDILHSVDFGLLSSAYESGPIALLEYMASGLPFLVTETGQISTRVAQAGMDFFTSPSDACAFAHALDTLICQPSSQLTTLGKKGQQLVTELYSIDMQVNHLLEIYSSLSLSNMTGIHSI